MNGSVGRLCSGCGEITWGRCPCGRSREQVRRRVYESRRWRRVTRPAVLRRDRHRCQRCGGLGSVVDHVEPIATLLTLGRDPFDPDECQLLCPSCSGRKDGGRERGAAGARVHIG